jgi:REP element-mobilizing transposase RayT
MNLDFKEYYRRNLPHVQPRGVAFLVNFRLAGSLPTNFVDQIRQESEELKAKLSHVRDQKERKVLQEKGQEKLFDKWDAALNDSQTGPQWLKEEKIAQVVANSIRFHDGDWFEVLAFCIMPNHVHLILIPYESSTNADYSLAKIMHNMKRNSANHANKILGRTGAFWQHESYDHFIRDDAELDRTVKYVLYNPVKANLVKEQADWKWSYCKYDM